ncbi:FG-GAP-like repeat-containing protein [Sphingomonas sp. LT1P40]|uniref:FG-GAP-like repeat-containing protein n=1 Tax=Alteristakelama amylovorans TaxID=3096166 RepID=UPI002FCB89C8
MFLTSATNTGATVDEGGSVAITASMLDHDDAEQTDDEIVYTITSVSANGTLYRNGVALGMGDSFTQADIAAGLISYTHDGGETVSDGFGFDVADGTGSTVSGAGFDFTITPVNDPPFSDWATIFMNEDGVATLTVSDFTQSYADPENDAFAGIFVTTLPASGDLLFDADGAGAGDPVAVTVGQFITASDIADGRLTYVPAAEGYRVGGSYDEFGFRAVDDGGTANGGDDTQDDEAVVLINVAPVNDAPVIDLDPVEAGSDAVASFTEGDGPLLLAPAALLDDDNEDFDGAVLTIAFTANGSADDQLTINDMGGGPGVLGIAGSDITYDGNVVGSFSGGSNGDPLVITFNSVACGCAVQLVMGNIAFSNSSDAIEASQRTVSFTLVDGGGTDAGGADTMTAFVTIDVTPVNDPPFSDWATIFMDEDGVATLTLGDFTQSYDDPEGDGFAGIIVTYLPAFGELLFDADGAGGADPVAVTVDQFITASDIVDGKLTYAPEPDGYYVGGSFDEFGFRAVDDGGIDDGGDDTQDDEAVVLINVAPVDDPPELDLDIAALSDDSETTFIENSGPIPLTGLPYFEDDGTDFTGWTLTITPDAGADANDMLTIADDAFLDLEIDGSDILYEGDVIGSFTGGSGGTPMVVTFNAVACDCGIQAVIESLRYEYVGELAAPDSREFTIAVSDGVTELDSQTATVLLEPADDAVSITAPLDATADEDVALAITGISLDDPDSSPMDIVTVTFTVTEGTLTFRTDVPGGIDEGAISGGGNGSDTIELTGTRGEINATLAAGGLSYLSDADFNGSDTLTIILPDVMIPAQIAFDGGVEPIGMAPGSIVSALQSGGEGVFLFAVESGGSYGLGVITPSGPAALPWSSLPTGFALADVNNDGMIDLVIVGTGELESDIQYLDAATGTPVLATTLPNLAVGLATADFNGDGRVDFMTIDGATGDICLILQEADGSGFQAPTIVAPDAVSGIRLAAGDFDGDGADDLLFIDADARIALLSGNGDGSFDTPTVVAAAAGFILSMVVTDLNDDGIADIAFTAFDGDGALGILLGQVGGGFAPPVYTDLGPDGAPASIAAGDIDGDGNLDLAVIRFGSSEPLMVLTGIGDGGFNAPETFETIEGDGIAVVDLDGDGLAEILIGGSGEVEFLGNITIAAGAVTATVAITVNAVDDAPVGDLDIASTDELTPITIAVLTNDEDIDGPAPTIATVNGVALTSGQSTMLDSGAIVTLNGDGTLGYDPNDAFDYLVTALTAAATGAVNASVVDTFSYTLAGSPDSIAVEVTVNGVSNAGDELHGDTGANSLSGTASSDYFDLSQGGADNANGGMGNDAFMMGAELDADDTIDGAGGTNDQVGLRGDYTGGNALVLGANTLSNIETIGLLSGAGNSYDITTHDNNVAAGQVLTVFGTGLGAGNNFTFDGSAETNGSFRIYGGAGTDDLTGGAQNDGFWFGPGRFDPTVDRVNGGGGTNDQLALDGDYTITLDGTAIQGVEAITLQRGPVGDSNSFNLTLADSLVADAGGLTIWGYPLLTSLRVDGSAEAGGDLRIYGGAVGDNLIGGGGDDWLWGGAGGDRLTGGAGADIFAYDVASQSTGVNYDILVGFNAAQDKIDLPFAVTSVAAPVSGNLSLATFNQDLAAAIGAAQMASGQAVLFTATGGDMAGQTFLIVNGLNSAAGYQNGSDYVFHLESPVGTIITPVPFV